MLTATDWQLHLSQHPPLWPHIVGYGAAVVLPILGLNGISRLLWQHIALDAGVPADETPQGYTAWLPATVGALERILYIASLLVGVPEFIGVWLALKVAGGWKGYSDGQEVLLRDPARKPVILRGRALFNTSLIVIALSLLWAAAGAAMIIWSSADRWDLAIATALVLFAGTYLMWLSLWLWWRKKTTLPTNAA